MKETAVRRARFVQIVDEANQALLIENLEFRLDVCPTWLTWRDLGRHGYSTFVKKELLAQRSNGKRSPAAARECKRGRLVQCVLGRDPNVVMQELWREISPIGPCHRVKFGMDLKCPKRRWISKRLEDRPLQLRRQVNLSDGAVAKPKPQDETGDVPSLDHIIGHHIHSNGSTRMSGWR
jgi:hypothetical protein